MVGISTQADDVEVGISMLLSVVSGVSWLVVSTGILEEEINVGMSTPLLPVIGEFSSVVAVLGKAEDSRLDSRLVAVAGGSVGMEISSVVL